MGFNAAIYALSKKYTDNTTDALGGVKGAPATIKSITEIDGGHRITFEWTGTSGKKETSTLDVMNGKDGKNGSNGAKGAKGDPGTNGVDGIGITSVEKTNTDGLVDTYTITFTDGSTFDYDITNGKDGTSGQGASTWSEIADKPFETLSTDFTVSKDGELSVIGGSGSGEENVIEEIKVNGVAQTPVDKSVDITIPDTADFVTNDELDAKGYLTQHQDLTDYAKKTDIPSVDNFVEKETGKSLIADTEITRLASVDNYDDSVVTKRVSNIETDYIKSTDLSTVATSGSYNDLTDKPTIPEEYDDTDVKDDITAVSDRVTAIEGDYATKTYVGEQIANAEHLKREIVTEIPEASTADDHTIYMLKVEDAVGNDKYREYMLIDGSVQCTGDTSVDLTDYAKTADVDSSIETLQNNKADKTEIPTTVAELTDASDYTKTETLTAHTDDADIHVTAELKEQYADAVAKTHEHVNSDVLDKLSEDADGKVLYNGTKITDNVWHGTREEFDAIETKDENVTYVVTDDEGSVIDYLVPKDAITTALSAESTDEEIPSAKLVYDSLQKMEISTKEQFATAEGNFIHVEDSVDGTISELGILGKSTQTHYDGKNILKPVMTTNTQNGLTCTAGVNGTYVINGTATADTWFNINTDVPVTVGTTYKLIGCPKNVSANLCVRRKSSNNAYGTDTGDGVTFTPDENAYVFIGVNSGVTLTNALFRPMITTDLDATYDTYEPYVGGTPSPNPEYPQSITSVGDSRDVIVTSCGKNLITYPYYQSSGEMNGITWTINSDGSVTANGTATKESSFNYIYPFSIVNDGKLTVGQTYTFSDGIVEPISGVYSQLVRYNPVTKKFDWGLSTAKGKNKTFTCSDTNLIDFGYRTVIDTGVTVNNLVFKPQLEIGEKNTEFEKYKESITTISLSEPLRSIGDVKDEITYQNGKFGILRRTGKYVINGTETLLLEDANKTEVGISIRLGDYVNYLKGISSVSRNTKDFITSHFRCMELGNWTPFYSTNNSVQKDNGSGAYRTSGNIWLSFGASDLARLGLETTIDAVKDWISNNNITVIYPLGTPTFEELDQSIPYSVATYKGITNISNKDVVDMSVKYPLTDSAASGSKNEAKIVELESKVSNCVTNTTSLQMLVPDGVDVADYVCKQGKTYLRYYTMTNSSVTNAPTNTSNGYIWYCLDANLVITARNSKGEIWTNAILNGNPIGWKKMNSTTVNDVTTTRIDLSECEETLSTNRTLVYTVKNGVCYVSFLNVKFKTATDTIFDVGTALPTPSNNYFWFPLIGVTDPTKSTLIHPTTDGKLEHHNTDINLTYSGSFSYPVAEN